MVKVRIQYDPINYGTEIAINGKYISKESRLYKIIEGKPIQEYLNMVTQLLINEWGKVEVDLVFSTLPEDQKELEMLFKRMKHIGKVQKLQLQTSQVKNKEVSITVIATMSSGKSTLINALLGQKLMPSRNEACTAKMTEILDSDKEIFTAKAYDESHQVIEEVSDLTYEIMVRLNEDPSVHRIAVEGKVPFLDAQGTTLMLADTPGPNNPRDKNHYEMTYREIKNSGNNLILYVLNATQLGTQDDATLLRDISDQMREGGKEVRDRFLFVVNKMDAFVPEEESIERVVEDAKKYLASFGIDNPQIFPCSAYAALNIRTHLAEMDIDSITYSEFTKLLPVARKTIDIIETLNAHAEMHLERYSTLSPTMQRELNYKLLVAEREGNAKEQALIHSGIISLESAIAEYIRKYHQVISEESEMKLLGRNDHLFWE